MDYKRNLYQVVSPVRLFSGDSDARECRADILWPNPAGVFTGNQDMVKWKIVVGTHPTIAALPFHSSAVLLNLTGPTLMPSRGLPKALHRHTGTFQPDPGLHVSADSSASSKSVSCTVWPKHNFWVLMMALATQMHHPRRRSPMSLGLQ